jgi:hypothetical protein
MWDGATLTRVSWTLRPHGMGIVLKYDNDPYKHTRMLSFDDTTKFWEDGVDGDVWVLDYACISVSVWMVFCTWNADFSSVTLFLFCCVAHG